jgi:pimeloyl-ACP methyl ester carboxylesterase
MRKRGRFYFWEDNLIETLNGVQLYFEVHGIGEPLILLHGFGGCSQDWSVLTDDWSKSFQLIIPDMRGHGRSSNPSKTFRHQDFATDILALLDHLKIGSF